MTLLLRRDSSAGRSATTSGGGAPRARPRPPPARRGGGAGGAAFPAPRPLGFALGAISARFSEKECRAPRRRPTAPSCSRCAPRLPPTAAAACLPDTQRRRPPEPVRPADLLGRRRRRPTPGGAARCPGRRSRSAASVANARHLVRSPRRRQLEGRRPDESAATETASGPSSARERSASHKTSSSKGYVRAA